MKPITRLVAVLASIMVCLWANQDFLTGTYRGPAWFAPVDFVMTQIMVYAVVTMLIDGVRFREQEPLIVIEVKHGE